jgi:hypothetical protein
VKTKNVTPKKLVKKLKNALQGSLRLGGAEWNLKCPDCGRPTFRVKAVQLVKGSCFISLKLVCAVCEGHFVLETGVTPHDSAWGRRLKLTAKDEQRDKGQMIRLWTQRLMRDNPTAWGEIEKMTRAEMLRAVRSVVGPF